MASPTSWLGISADPRARTVSSTLCARSAIASSSTGRPWQAFRTPATILARLNGSVTPLRLTTARTASSTVVKRRPHSGQERRRRMIWPSSASRESTTRESACRQYGQRIGGPPLRCSSGSSSTCRRKPTQMGTPRHNDHPALWAPLCVLTMSTMSSQTQLVGDLHKCNYYILCRHRPGRKLIRETGTIVLHGSSRSSTPRNGEFLPDLQTVTVEVVEAADVLDRGRAITPGGDVAGDAPQRVAGSHDLGRQRRGVGRLA